jgi:hypothetical protein
MELVRVKTVLILTIARSGSSLLSGILVRLGVDMGKETDMKIGKHLNKYGSYENQEFLKFSVNLLFDVGILLNYPKRFTNYEAKMKKTAEKYRLKLRELIQKYKKEDIWGFKEASLIYYLPYLQDEFTNPKYIHLIRDYNRTARSLLDTLSRKNWMPERRDKIKFFTYKRRLRLYLRLIRLFFTEKRNRNESFFRKVVEDSHERIEKFLQDKKYLTVYLNNLTTNPVEVIHQIICFLEISPTKEQVANAISFIHPEELTK